ncbi:MAG: transposase [Candidatus Portnoybacteria bacterium]
MEFYHVLNRGVDKRDIFLEERDYFRFVHNLFEFNDQKNIINNFFYFEKGQETMGLRNPYKRNLLVDIHAFCLMPNHYHLLLQPKMDNGISLFMRKVNTGYANYFNKKYSRSGALFQGRYKSVLMERDDQFMYIVYYIHLNPLDLKFPEWREGKIKDFKKAMDFLNSYRWSSHLDFIGQKNFPSVTKRDYMINTFGGRDRYIRDTEEKIMGLRNP